MVKAEVKNKIVFPKEFKTQADLSAIANTIFIPLMREGIERGVGVDGAPFPPPKSKAADLLKVSKRAFTKSGNIRAGTIKQIEKTGLLGFGKKILIDTGKLVGSFKARNSGKYTVEVVNTRTTDSGENLGDILQLQGVRIGKGTKTYKFFGISKGMEADAMQFANDKILAICKMFNHGAGI